MVQNIGKLEKMVKVLEAERGNQQAAELSKQAEFYGDISLIINVFEKESVSNIKYLAESLRTDATRLVSFLVTTLDGRLSIACSVSEDLIKANPSISAAKLVKEAISVVGGGGGGQSSMATAGAKTVANVEGVLTIIRTRIAEISSL
jgi:alanyl-tRNA synthetase